MKQILIPRDKMSPEHIMLAAVVEIATQERVDLLVEPEDNNIQRFVEDSNCLTVGLDDSPLSGNYKGGAPSYLQYHDNMGGSTELKQYLVLFEHTELWGLCNLLGTRANTHIEYGVQTRKCITFLKEIILAYF